MMIAGIVASLVMGISLGILGAGGSLLTLPILVYFFSVPVIDATRLSLLIVGLIALIGWVQSLRHRDVVISTTLSFGFPSIVGVLISRRILLPRLPEFWVIGNQRVESSTMLLILFATVMLAAAVSLLRPTQPRSNKGAPSPLVLSGLGLGVGLLAGFLGAGGGFLIVPALLRFAALSITQAIGTSLGVIALQSLIGVSTELPALPPTHSRILLMVLGSAAIGMILGLMIRPHVQPQRLKKAFGVFVLVSALVILGLEIMKGNL